jgi:hypothetical protein
MGGWMQGGRNYFDGSHPGARPGLVTARCGAQGVLEQLLAPTLSSYGMGMWLFNRNLGKPIRIAGRRGAIAGTGSLERDIVAALAA